MDDQASLKRDHGTSTNGVVGSLSNFGNDVASLAELQLKLAAMDAKIAAERAAVPFGLVAGGLSFLVASLPVLLLGVAALLASALHIHQGLAMLAVGGVTLVLAGLVVALAGWRLSHSFESFQRSSDELARNITWIRTVLLYSGRPVKKSGR